MKNIYLLCNAHLDPIWLWTWNEGAAEAISTFRTAADFCEKNEDFIFNHNESLLYEWVEEYEPELFERIKKLVKCGRWKIMGGWYLQPDCNMLSGESFIRQISYGRKYFKEKFGVVPEIAINLDPFGHTRGLVQILKKTGYNSYLFMRPDAFKGDFIWEGFDGSRIKAHGISGGYNSLKGRACYKIDDYKKDYPEKENGLVLWGIGDHGGGPSALDLQRLGEYIKNDKEYNIKHSCCEEYFNSIDSEKLKVVDTSLTNCTVGCYTSMTRIKQANRRIENKFEMCRRMAAQSGIEMDNMLFEKVEKALMLSQFHDVLPGSMIKKAEDDSLNRLGFAEETADKFIAKAFFKLCEGQKPGKSGEIPILVYNPLPYRVEREIEVEFQLEDQNWSRDETTIAHVKNSSGEFIFSQNEKEDCTFFLDWRKKIAFRAVLEPMSVNRFDCELECIKNYKKIADYDFDENYIIFDNEHLSVRINRKTGLIDKYAVDGKDMLNKGSGAINVYNDDEDPWGMRVDGFYDKCASFSLMSDADANEYNGYPDETKENVRVIENGEVRTKVQAIFEYGRSVAIVTYTVPKHDTYVDIDIKMLTNDVNKLFKLSFDTTIEENVFLGQTAFGTDKLLKEEKEVTFQKWCGFENKDKRFYVINNGTYGGSADKNILNITLLRTPVYSAHPIVEQIAPTDRNHEHIDIGERNFKYRITSEKNIDCEAESFNLPPYALSFFPSGKEGSGCDAFELDNKEILLSTFQKCDDKIIFRLYNSQNRKNTAGFKILGDSYIKEFNPFEVKTFVADSSGLKETDMLGE